MLSLGDQDFCTKVRTIRETARFEATDTQISLWDIDRQMQEEIERQKSELEAERNSERIRRLEAMREMRYGHRSPMIGLDKEKLYDNNEEINKQNFIDSNSNDDDDSNED